MITESLLFYIGCALIPTPPSPCPDFGGQFVLVVVIGLLAPKYLVRPIYIFFHSLGDLAKQVFGKIPGVRILVEKVDQVLQKWFRFMKKKRSSENVVVDRLYKIFLREDLIERLIFGYFVTIVVGSLFMAAALFL